MHRDELHLRARLVSRMLSRSCPAMPSSGQSGSVVNGTSSKKRHVDIFFTPRTLIMSHAAILQKANVVTDERIPRNAMILVKKTIKQSDHMKR